MKKIDLLQGNIAGTLTRLALPLMGMSLLQMTYNLIDMFWISQLGAGAVASVGTGGLMTWLAMGIHTLAQLGGTVYTAQNLGAKEYKKSSQFAFASVVLSIIISTTLGAIYMIFTKQIISFFDLTDPNVILGAEIYVQIAGGVIIFGLLGKLFTALLTAIGNSKIPFIATAVGVIINVILDPILIFGMLGFPKMGVAGVAIATVFAQFIVFLILFIYIIKKKILFSTISIKELPKLGVYQRILKLSFPAACQATLFPLISMYVSKMVASFGDDAVAVQRIGSQVESISWMTTDGYATAVNSFMAQNFGAENLKRVKNGFFTAFKLLFVYGIFASCVLIFLAEPLFSIFLSEQPVLSMGTDYLVILGFSQLFMCMEILSASGMNALGKSTAPAAISITFTALRIPIAAILSSTVLALNGIWWAVSISSVFKGVIIFLLIAFYLKRNEKFKTL